MFPVRWQFVQFSLWEWGRATNRVYASLTFHPCLQNAKIDADKWEFWDTAVNSSDINTPPLSSRRRGLCSWYIFMAASRYLRYSSIIVRLLSTSSCIAQETDINQLDHNRPTYVTIENIFLYKTYLRSLGLAKSILLLKDLGVFLQVFLDSLLSSKK